jgi:hypothetical protein
MSALFIDSKRDDEERRRRLYRGGIFVFSAADKVLSFGDRAVDRRVMTLTPDCECRSPPLRSGHEADRPCLPCISGATALVAKRPVQ